MHEEDADPGGRLSSEREYANKGTYKLHSAAMHEYLGFLRLMLLLLPIHILKRPET